MSTNKSIIDDILRREGGAAVTNDPRDAGGRTQYGIAERSNPGAWKDGKVTEEEARAIYERKYITAPGFNAITDERLRAQLVDFGVNSGPAVAVQKLQACLKVEQDGVLGPKTLAVLAAADPQKVNNQVALERIKMIGRIVQKNPTQAKFLNGWISRAIDFWIS